MLCHRLKLFIQMTSQPSFMKEFNPGMEKMRTQKLHLSILQKLANFGGCFFQVLPARVFVVPHSHTLACLFLSSPPKHETCNPRCLEDVFDVFKGPPESPSSS
eukprot:m.30096 g.30096  ORF g.30096 m.30096 type:complete len:103 (-) comp14481_c0_seq2:73-381(-)